MLKRKQVYLEPEQERRLRRLARRTGSSDAEHIRRALDEYLSREEPEAGGEDPILDLIGICDRPEGPRDVAQNHDRYLYGRRSGT